jgi:two-component system chemotaxis response regulator CheB
MSHRAASRESPLVIGLVASTGGPPAIARILAALPARFPVPLLVAQHVAPGFTEGLRRLFAEATQLPVRVAADGGFLGPGVWLAPDSRDLALDVGGVLRTPFPATSSPPSGDVLLRSLARLGPRAMGVVLTGMGEDGAQGLLALRKAGGRAYAQDQATSTVFGMPEAADRLGAVQAVLSLDHIAPLILELA